MSEHFINVVCNNPRHPRGKTTKVALFRVFVDPLDGERRYEDKTPVKVRKIDRLVQRREAGEIAPNYALMQGLGLGHFCNLCGQQIPHGIGLKLSEVLFALADNGVEQTSLSVLLSKVSKQERR